MIFWIWVIIIKFVLVPICFVSAFKTNMVFTVFDIVFNNMQHRYFIFPHCWDIYIIYNECIMLWFSTDFKIKKKINKHLDSLQYIPASVCVLYIHIHFQLIIVISPCENFILKTRNLRQNQWTTLLKSLIPTSSKVNVLALENSVIIAYGLKPFHIS